jgi:hypothetical protein
MNREAIYSALFALISTAAGFATASRKLRHWDDVPLAEQPALFQVQRSEEVRIQTGQPAKLLMRLDLYIYNAATDPGASPAIGLNALLDAVTHALAPQPGQDNQTLGGLVNYCRISGTIQTDEGVLGPQAVAIVPVELLAYGNPG